MPKCPNCKNGIFSIRMWEKVDTSYDLTFDNKGGAIYQNQDSCYENCSDQEYLCPECSEPIAKTEAEAKEFLKEK